MTSTQSSRRRSPETDWAIFEIRFQVAELWNIIIYFLIHQSTIKLVKVIVRYITMTRGKELREPALCCVLIPLLRWERLHNPKRIANVSLWEAINAS